MNEKHYLKSHLKVSVGFLDHTDEVTDVKAEIPRTSRKNPVLAPRVVQETHIISHRGRAIGDATRLSNACMIQFLVGLPPIS